MKYLLLLIFTIILDASNDEVLYNEFGIKYDIPNSLIRYIIKHESNNNQFAIGLVERNIGVNSYIRNHLKKEGIKHKAGKFHISIFPENLNEAYYVYQFLEYLEVKNYDLGLMQINSNNIKRKNLNALKLLSDKKYNIDFGVSVIRYCFDKFYPDPVLAIECYNKGDNRKKLNRLRKKGLLNYHKKIFAQYNKEN